MSNAAVAAISVALYILLAPGVGGLLQGVDRKATARMQGAKVRRCSSPSTMWASCWAKKPSI